VSKNLYSEAGLLQSLARGDEKAFEQIYSMYSPDVYRTARQFLQNEELAADLLQDIFITIWIRRESFLKVNNLRAYLITMSRNLALTYLRDLAKEISEKEKWSIVLPKTENETEQKLNRKTLGKILEESIDQLPPQQKRVFRLAKIEGMSYEEIANQLNISPITVKQHIIAANKSVRRRLEEYGIPLSVCILIFFQ
jgi:RNA polymerase sigma-70 factor (ECF subfamily)